MLGLNLKDLPRLHGVNGGQRGWYQWKQILERVAGRLENDHAEPPLREILLELQVLVRRHEHHKAGGFGLREQRPVLHAGPRFLLDRANFVTDQVRPNLPRQLLIEQNAHGW